MELNEQRGGKVNNVSRRKLLKILTATGGAIAASSLIPNKWSSPIVETGAIPVHAQATTPTPTLAATIDPNQATPTTPTATPITPTATPAGCNCATPTP